MMLRHLQLTSYATNIENAVWKTIRDGKVGVACEGKVGVTCRKLCGLLGIPQGRGIGVAWRKLEYNNNNNSNSNIIVGERAKRARHYQG